MDKSCLQLTSSTVWLSDLETPSPPFYASCTLLRQNLCSTPLSENRHHILIDDMDREKLDRLISEGYQPAILLESSPGSYQAIITVPKLGTAHDKDVGNRLSDTLNREYGDPKLSGAVHPHRAPGYENRKPEHQREDGGYPEVRLLKAERCECTKTLALSHQIDAEYQQLAALKAQQSGRKAKLALDASGIAVASGIGINVYITAMCSSTNKAAQWICLAWTR